MNRNWKLVANAGFTNSFYLTDLPFDNRGRESGWFLGTTVCYKNLSLNINYDWSAGYFNVPSADVDLQGPSLMVGYRIFQSKYGRR